MSLGQLWVMIHMEYFARAEVGAKLTRFINPSDAAFV